MKDQTGKHEQAHVARPVASACLLSATTAYSGMGTQLAMVFPL
jgi:hypothetical protein